MSEISNDMIYDLLKEMSAQIGQINNRLDRIESKISTIEQTTNTTQEHVARIDERLTQTEKISKLFDPEAVDRAAR